MTASFKQFRELDRKLAWQGFPKLSPWWLGEMRRFDEMFSARPLWGLGYGKF